TSKHQSNHKKGEKERLLLRPEHIDIKHDERGDAVVEQVDFQGASQLIKVRFAAQEFVIKYCNHCYDSVLFM
ncbi:TOBE domain-containing protein, partial [Psychromonas aquatilis]